MASTVMGLPVNQGMETLSELYVGWELQKESTGCYGKSSMEL